MKVQIPREPWKTSDSKLTNGSYLKESWMTCSFWTGIAFCTFTVMAWLFPMQVDTKSYSVLAPWAPWRGPLKDEQGSMAVPINVADIGAPDLEIWRSKVYVNDTEQRNPSKEMVLNATENGAKGSPLLQTDDSGDSGIDDGYVIQQTHIRGKAAVNQFQKHAACLSDSGQWIYDPKPRKLPWLAVKNYDWVSRCDKSHKSRGGTAGETADSIVLANGTSDEWSVREELKWRWQTNDSGCAWHPMDRDDLCRRIGSNRNILVVGDSINHELSIALQNALTMNVSSTSTSEVFPGEELCSDVLGGTGKGILVRFIRNDYISPVVNATSLGRNFQDPWMPHLDAREWGIKILVLNRGAHWESDHRFELGLRETFAQLRDRHPDLLVLYRNTPSGHVNCTDFNSPLPGPLKGATPSFHWEEFDRQNLLAKSIVEEFHYIHVDVARAIGMRPEGHMHGHDCLHYCQPGPLDLAVEMIYNILLLL